MDFALRAADVVAVRDAVALRWTGPVIPVRACDAVPVAAARDAVPVLAAAVATARAVAGWLTVARDETVADVRGVTFPGVRAVRDTVPVLEALSRGDVTAPRVAVDDGWAGAV